MANRLWRYLTFLSVESEFWQFLNNNEEAAPSLVLLDKTIPQKQKKTAEHSKKSAPSEHISKT